MKIKELRGNTEKMKNMTAQSILANGKVSLKKYFSFNDDIERGYLKNILRGKIGL